MNLSHNTKPITSFKKKLPCLWTLVEFESRCYFPESYNNWTIIKINQLIIHLIWINLVCTYSYCRGWGTCETTKWRFRRCWPIKYRWIVPRSTGRRIFPNNNRRRLPRCSQVMRRPYFFLNNFLDKLQNTMIQIEIRKIFFSSKTNLTLFQLFYLFEFDKKSKKKIAA